MRLKTQQQNSHTQIRKRRIQVAPDSWSSSHTQRLFHVSLLLVIIVIIAAIVLNLLFILFPVYAGSISADSQTVQLTAYVSGVSSGPTTPTPPTSGGGGGGPSIPPAPPVVTHPNTPATPEVPATLRIDPYPGQALTTEVVNENGKKVPVPVFNTSRPKFIGYTNVPFAQVSISLVAPGIAISGTSTTDSNGAFLWESAPLHYTGVYTVTMNVTSLTDASNHVSSSLDFAANLSLGNAVGGSTGNSSGSTPFVPPAITDELAFSLFTSVADATKHVQAGQQVQLNLQLSNKQTSNTAVEVPLNFIVEDTNGNIVLQSSETLAVQGMMSFTKILYTAPNTVPGEYMVLVEIPSLKLYVVASDTFVIDKPPVVPVSTNQSSKEIAPLLSVRASIVLILFFLILAYFEFWMIRAHSKDIRNTKDTDHTHKE